MKTFLERVTIREVGWAISAVGVFLLLIDLVWLAFGGTPPDWHERVIGDTIWGGLLVSALHCFTERPDRFDRY